MKKVYEKPQVYMERFELAEHIAVCGLQLGSTDTNSCRVTNDRGCGGMAEGLFQFEPVCSFSDFEQYCYSGGPGEMYAIFQS